MARQTRSSSGNSAPTFSPQNLLQYSEKEWCTFDSAYPSALQTSGIFPEGTLFRPYDRELRSDMSSTEWLGFIAFPFTLGLRFPFSDLITEFFCITDLSFSQTMSMLWRVLVVLDQIKNVHIPELSVSDFPIAYRLRSHESSRFLFYSTTPDPLILRPPGLKRNGSPTDFRKLALPLADSEKRIKAIYQLPDPERSFVQYATSSSQHSSSNMSDTCKMPILLDLDEFDSYPTPIQVEKETLATTSSKPSAAPKRNLRTRASTMKKRKGSDITAPAPEGFSYEDLSFTDSLEPLTSFLHKVISWHGRL
ncbi:hypothetical protein Hanom_Chr07g00623061 [Helianthus anomalus]